MWSGKVDRKDGKTVELVTKTVKIVKTKNLVLSFALSLSAISFLSSAIPTGSHSLAIGIEAPAIRLTPATDFELPSLEGEYVLLNFWSASDAMSRINNRKYSGMKQIDGHSVRVVSVCIDEDSSLAAEIARADGIVSSSASYGDSDALEAADPESVVSLMGKDLMPEVLADYQVSSGCRAFLISPYGCLERIL